MTDVLLVLIIVAVALIAAALALRKVWGGKGGCGSGCGCTPPEKDGSGVPDNHPCASCSLLQENEGCPSQKKDGESCSGK